VHLPAAATPARAAPGWPTSRSTARPPTSTTGWRSPPCRPCSTRLCSWPSDLPNPLALGLWVGVISQFVPTVGTYIAAVLPGARVAHRGASHRADRGWPSSSPTSRSRTTWSHRG
jgi:hypothetical protein